MQKIPLIRSPRNIKELVFSSTCSMKQYILLTVSKSEQFMMLKAKNTQLKKIVLSILSLALDFLLC